MVQYLDLLKGLGVPAAIIAAMTIAICFRKINPRASRAAAIITLAGVAAFVSIDLYPRARDAFWAVPRIETSPSEFFAFSADGEPVKASIAAYRGDTLLIAKTIVPISLNRVLAKQLHLKRKEDGFVALNGTVPVGVVSDDSIRAAGLVPFSGGRHQSEVLHTRRVYRGQTIEFRNTSHGSLKIRFLRIGSNGGAVVTLISDALGKPRPSEITVKNKALDSQIFQGIHEFLIVVREADFTKESVWAAFTVVDIH